MTVQVTTNTGVASVKGVPQAKVMSRWNGGTGIAQFAGAAPLLTVQLNPINPNGPILPETLESYGGGPNGPHFYCLFFTWSLGHLGSV